MENINRRDGELSAVSVIIPTRDTLVLTTKCVASVLRSGAKEQQIILVDDGSTDGSAEALRRRFPHLHVTSTPTSHGFTAAANRGLEMAQGEIKLLLNSDTELAEDTLAAFLVAFATRPQLGIAGARLFYPDGRAGWCGGAVPTASSLFATALGAGAVLDRMPFYRKFHPPSGASGGEVDWVPGAAMAIRSQVLDEVGDFDRRFALYAQDLDLCCRARAAGWRIAVLPDARVVHHHGATIRRGGGAYASTDVGLLWTDLLRWAEKSRPERFSRRARRALLVGGSIRLAIARLRGREATELDSAIADLRNANR